MSTELAEGIDGIFAGGFDGWVEAEDGADTNRDGEGGEEDININIRGERGDEGDGEGASVTEGEAEDAAENGEDETFKEELKEDIEIGGTDGLSDTDFVGALGDGDEHNIHDADAADEQGNAGDEGEHTRDDIKKGAGGVGDLVAVGDGEIGIARFTFS